MCRLADDRGRVQGLGLLRPREGALELVRANVLNRPTRRAVKQAQAIERAFATSLPHGANERLQAILP